MTGFLIDPIVFVKSVVRSLPLVTGIVAALMVRRWVGAADVGRAFGYPQSARLTMWALTLPQVAATLAATLVAYDTRNAAASGCWTARWSIDVGHIGSRAGSDGTLRTPHARCGGAFKAVTS